MNEVEEKMMMRVRRNNTNTFMDLSLQIHELYFSCFSLVMNVHYLFVIIEEYEIFEQVFIKISRR